MSLTSMKFCLSKAALVIFTLSIVGLVLYDYHSFLHRLGSPYHKVKYGDNRNQKSLVKVSNTGNIGNKYDNFPLSNELLNRSLYTSYSLKTFTDPHKNIINLPEGPEADELDICQKLEYTATFEISKQKIMEAEYKRIIDAISRNSEYYKLLDQIRKKHKSNIPEEKRWLRFGGSSIWLEDYNVHYMVSRVLYSPSGIPNKAFVSFLYVQLFDKEGQELFDVSLDVPYIEKTDNSIYGLDGNISINKKSNVIKHRTLTFPSVLPIKFDYKFWSINGKFYWGPEDPRVIARENPDGFIEPLIVFNMKSLKLRKRVMYSFLPFSNTLTLLTITGKNNISAEKNWIPFFSQQISQVTQNDIISFVYSMDPLEVLSCEINTGICDFVQKTIEKKKNYVGPLRGGTQLVPLPFDSAIPSHLKSHYKLPENRQIYIGWARTHLNNCGCGESMYRPNLIILVEDLNPETKKFYYKIADVSEYVDFNVKVPPWSIPKLDNEGNILPPSPKQCEGRNVLIPNSIAFWKVFSIEKDGITYDRKSFSSIKPTENISDNLIFNDYMGVTLSAADSDVSIVYLKGMLQYILSIHSLFETSNVIQNDREFQHIGFDLNEKCSLTAMKEFCLKYGEEDNGIFLYNP